MPNSRNLLTIWHLLCLGFLSSLIVFLLGHGICMLKGGKSIGIGYINISKFLFNPTKYQLIFQNVSPFSSESEQIAYGRYIKLLYFPFGLFMFILVFVQAIVFIIITFGNHLGIVIIRASNCGFQPEHVKCIHIDLYKNPYKK